MILCSRPVHGLIFLFKWQPGEEPAGSIVQDSRLDQIFFAKQVYFGVLNAVIPSHCSVLFCEMIQLGFLEVLGNQQCVCDPSYRQRAAELLPS